MRRTAICFYLLICLCLTSFAALADGIITGKVVDATTGEELIGSTVMLKGTTRGTATKFDGTFELKSPAGKQTLVFSYVGYADLEKTITVTNGSTVDLGQVGLDDNAIGIAEVSVLASVAVNRETPVAISTIKPEIIQEKLGSQEFPEILRSTPSVYVTRQGGGYGDSRINLRGFDSRNIAVLINGVPINGMENGKVYWSNWAGLSDVTRSMQVQRGLGAAKVAVPSVGGTINILTNTTDSKRGGSAYYGTGNDGRQKEAITLSTGMTEDGWAASVNFAHNSGKGWVNATDYDSWSYFANVSKRINDYHSLSLTVFGAPQTHGQRYQRMKISEYQTIARDDYRYNPDWGWKNGEKYNSSQNYYHKPQAILNHFWTLNPSTSISTALYGSVGRGGGRRTAGDNRNAWGYKSTDYRVEGQIDYDKIVDENIAAKDQGSQAYFVNSVNNHEWVGILSNLTHEIDDRLKLTGGYDLRWYKGMHYKEVDDLLGGSFAIDDGDVNNPNRSVWENDTVSYYNEGKILWEGGFAQLEYSNDIISAFVSGSFSAKQYKRIDYFKYKPGNQETDWNNFFGFSIKGGANYNITEKHNVFVNAGYFERQPDFNAVYTDNSNNFNEQAAPERVTSFEIGYGFTTPTFQANLNGYYTLWLDKTMNSTVYDQGGNRYTATLLGLDALHMGLELDMRFTPTRELTITGQASIGDWKWQNNVTDVQLFDENQNPYGETLDVYIKDVHVGDAAQTTISAGIDYEVLKDVKIGADYSYYAKNFAQFYLTSRKTAEPDGASNPDSWQLPNYGLVDLNIRWDFKLGGLSSTLYGKANNILNTEYVSDALDGTNHTWQEADVYYGMGTTWSMGFRVRF
ncbi:TonB-dependent receptor [Halosquirtibacter xylanolyticus]|uniref:TonB-dependent receptor n=1 Tax=Halosquirtibacter xylanolyticus TaxID=3374599 RepID=UPI0037484EAA|nr:TonB-dependent receptor [Prolixibacteraceae bacterium]